MLTLGIIVFAAALGVVLGGVFWQFRRQKTNLMHQQQAQRIFARARHIQELADTWRTISPDLLILNELYLMKQEALDHVIALTGFDAKAQTELEELGQKLENLGEPKDAPAVQPETRLDTLAQASAMQTHLREIKRLLRSRRDSNMMGEQSCQVANALLAELGFKIEIDTCIGIASDALLERQYINARSALNHGLALVKRSDISKPEVEAAFKEISELLRSIPETRGAQEAS